MNDDSDPVKSLPLSGLVDGAARFQEAAAERLGLNPTDLRCLSLVAAEPGTTASHLAERSGLTTGAVTGVLDRLERARLVKREADPADRRRILVRPLPDRLEELAAVYDPLDRAFGAVLETYGAAERSAVERFAAEAVGVLEEQTARLRARSRGGIVGEMFSAPRGDATVARLVFQSGAPRLALRAAPLGPDAEARMVAELAHTALVLRDGEPGDDLARGTFTGPMPDVRTRPGLVSVRYRRRIDWRRRSATIALSPAVAWVVDVAGGLSSLTAELRATRVRSLSVRGGVERLELRLPDPDGTSRLSLAGGAADVAIRHAPGTAVRLTARGGIHDARFGAERLRQVHGELRIETPDAGSKADRWEIEIAGGARTLSVLEG